MSVCYSLCRPAPATWFYLFGSLSPGTPPFGLCLVRPIGFPGASLVVISLLKSSQAVFYAKCFLLLEVVSFWEHIHVLQVLISAPFEPLEEVSLTLLTQNVNSFMAIPSARLLWEVRPLL